MKRPFILFFLILLFLHPVYAQSKKAGNAILSGKIIDSASHLPLEYATITIYTSASQLPFSGSTSDNAGLFTLNDIPAGNYRLMVESIGYNSFNIPTIEITKNSIIDLKNISLTKKSVSLQNITVVAHGRLVENKIDKMVYNAEKDITSQSGVATDILRKVPMVSVDVNGNVELSGSSGIRFLINGKPSSMFGSNIADVLQSIPASQIKSIEVITNPGARYDAQGLGGIINIILKKNTAHGTNSTISLASGSRTDNGSFNFNARKNDFGFHAYVSGNIRPYATTPYTSNRNSSDSIQHTSTLYQQDGSSRFRRQAIQTGLGFDWTVKEKNNYSGSVSYNQFGYTGNGTVFQHQKNWSADQSLLSDVNSLSNTSNFYKAHNIDAGFNYKRTFDKEDQELEVSITSSLNNSTSTAGNNQLLLPMDSLYYGINNRNPGKETETELEVNYTQPLQKEIQLGLGGKFSLLDISSQADIWSLVPNLKSYTRNKALSNNLDYHQKVYAFYSEIKLPVGSLFDAKMGARYERTEINSFYSNAQRQIPTPGYNTLVPSIYFSKKIGDRHTLKLSYSKRIERPDYGDLNPFINTADPKNITAGNPYLKPEIGNRYELGYALDLGSVGSFMANLFYRANNHDIQPYIMYYPVLVIGDSTFSNVSVSSRENIGMEKNTGLNLFGDIHYSNKFTFRSNLFFFHRHIINVLQPGFDAYSFNYRMNINLTYQFNTRWVGEFFGNFNSPRNEVQGRYPSFVTYSFAFRKQFWNKKGSLALTATNPFNEYVNQQTEVKGPNFSLNSNRKIPFRSFGVNFTWKFGKLEFKKEKDEIPGGINGPTD
ncbi:TonB-dependent receptor domain-containing protein [Flavisolibacter ginsengisoli]|uniref:Outer membrane receptor proteins, mostly Fe transport n=1 Tax=Flavisolibacter ginsengisoli DSM 18119 TaxID=1121884 RepID=A0A1M4UCF7_9BACT|nr:TonB-dependent receptor [Flavisolibacter ginsengisoli]SHE54298.1 Outer membrane receptor proteins, mostly Fe transport [Flavisolibacter ginsengisoli DSM 18119]